MFSALYIEEAVLDHPRTQEIRQRFDNLPVIVCERYTEVFNPKSQNFRLQKPAPGLILAAKHGRTVLAAPAGYGIGLPHNYYFSHMMNCPYDCRYCFLQGMYHSAHLVLFVNYEKFAEGLQASFAQHAGESACYFSGYDCDSLALEPVSGFGQYILDVFRNRPDAWLELRTKSTQVRFLLDQEPVDNCVVAFSFTSEYSSTHWENRVAKTEKRIDAMVRLQQQGWNIGLRFDPLLYHPDFYQQYKQLFDTIFARITTERLHSVSLGMFRLPSGFHKRMLKLYPDEPLLVTGLEKSGKMISYNSETEKQMFDWCEQQLLNRIPKSVYYPCQF